MALGLHQKRSKHISNNFFSVLFEMQKQYTSQRALIGISKAASPSINTPRADSTLL